MNLQKAWNRLVAGWKQLEQESAERERRAIASARFPWLAVLSLFAAHFAIGWVLAQWHDPMSELLLFGVGILSFIFLCIGVSINESGDTILFADSFFLSLLVGGISMPWGITAQLLTYFYKRCLSSLIGREWVLEIWLGFTPILSFFTLLLLQVIGLGLGYFPFSHA